MKIPNLKSLLIFTGLLSFFLSYGQDRLVSMNRIDSFSRQEVLEFLTGQGIPEEFMNIDYGVELYQVLYLCEYKDSLTEVSGLLARPLNATCKAPLLLYHHGTQAANFNNPSTNPYGGEALICMLLAGEGYVVGAPDYIGLGTSNIRIHPYQHAFSQAHSSINLARAIREINSNEIELNLGHEIMLTGYSQGGFSTMASLKYMQESYAEEFTVSCAAPMSGAYDMDGVQSVYLTRDAPYPTPGYVGYIILSYMEMYPDRFADYSFQDIFVEPYDSLMPTLFYGNRSIGYINSQCPDTPNLVLQIEELEDYKVNPNHPLRMSLRENSLLEWAPDVPVSLHYCEGDDQVTYLNSVVADSAWRANGAPSVRSLDFGMLNHDGCVLPAVLATRKFFNDYRTNGINASLAIDQTQGQVEVAIETPENYRFQWNNGLNGRTIGLNNISSNEISVEVEEKSSGCRTTLSLDLIPDDLSERTINATVMPNPASTHTRIRWNRPFTGKLLITDLLGKVVLEKSLENQDHLYLEVDHWPRGNYIVRSTLSGSQDITRFSLR